MYEKVKNRLHHENWPSPVFYLPVFLYYLYSSFKHGGRFNYFSVVNPGLKTGGLCGFSKWESFKLISSEYIPKTLLLKKEEDHNTLKVKEEMQNLGLEFPVILKPDCGERGFLVYKLENMLDLTKALKLYADKVDFLIQEYIEGDLELGVFIIKKNKKWIISSLMSKKFLSVVGDGTSTLSELCQKDVRAERFFLSNTSNNTVDMLKVLPKGESMVLEHIGNHCRGTEFINEMNHNDESLREVFSDVVEKQTDLNYIRLDIRTKSWDHLNKGEFKVLEVNGVSAEPGHIYDTKFTLTEAYKDLFHHWMEMSEIAGEQIDKGFEPEKLTDTIKDVFSHLANKKRLMSLQKEGEEDCLFVPPDDINSLSIDEVMEHAKEALPKNTETLFEKALDLGGYLRFCMYKDSNYEVVLCKWKPQKGSDEHDHKGKDCCFEVLSGEVSEYRKVGDENITLNANSRGHICDKQGPHIMFNKTDVDAITLHVYKNKDLVT